MHPVSIGLPTESNDLPNRRGEAMRQGLNRCRTAENLGKTKFADVADVGWVEQGATQHRDLALGFVALQPTCKTAYNK
jgi:hypothetical protein